MKKFIKTAIPTAIILCVALAFAGCEKPKTTYEKLCDNVSYMQTGYYIAEDDNFDVKLSSTRQEELFIADGKADAKKDITLLTLTPKDSANLSKTYEYTLTGDKSSVSGSITKSRLGINMSCKIQNAAEIGAPKTLEIKEKDTENTPVKLELQDKCPAQTDANAALEIAYTHYKDAIDQAINSKTFDRECYVKLLCQSQGSDEPEYYWYVSFIKDKNDYWSVIINPENKEIVSSRENGGKTDKK